MSRVLVIDLGARTGKYRLKGSDVVQLEDYSDVFDLFDQVVFLNPDRLDEARVLKSAFRSSGRRSDHRGGPIYQYIKPMLDSSADYFCHLDCDIIFHVAPGVNWISKAIEVIESHHDVAAVAPHSGPACDVESFVQPGNKVRERGALKLIDFVSTRKFVMSKEWFLSQLPLVPQYSGHLDRIKSILSGSSALLPLEVHLSNLFRTQNLWRADLPAELAWCLHLPSHSKSVLTQLPRILEFMEDNKFPEGQGGHFDLKAEIWEVFNPER